jgi:hypothetical protein
MNKQIFGFDCPGCGTQRAIALVLEGDFIGAFQMFPPVYTTILFFIVAILQLVNKSRSYSTLLIALAIINVVSMIISYIYKLSNLF